MKRLFSHLLPMLLITTVGLVPYTTHVLAQSDIPVKPEPAAVKYWIFLKDKTSTANKTQTVQVTPAAHNRRAKRATYTGTQRDFPVSADYIDALLSRQINIHVQSRWLNAVSAYLTEDQLTEVRGLPFVDDVKPVGRLLPLAEPQAAPVVAIQPLPDVRKSFMLSYGSSITQLERVNAVPPLEEGLSGSGVKLGIIDTGMGDLPQTHPATADMVTDGRFIESQDFTGQAPDASRHGYSVLSVAAGFAEDFLIGPAYGADVYHARTEYTPTETNQEEDNFVAGIEWMESQGVDVVNISLGYSTFDNGQNSYGTNDLDGETGITTIAADMAVEMGMVVVASAGNEGCISPSACWYYITTPADGDHVITVGAVNAAGNLASFSSHGPTSDGRTKPDVVAQGASVYLANSAGAYSFSNGTSFSSPMVAGIVALMLEVNPDLTPDDIRTILQTTADRAESPDNDFGWGTVDAEAAVLAAETLLILATDEPDDLPRTLSIESPHPNPAFNNIALSINNQGSLASVTIALYDSQGRLLHRGYEGPVATGRHQVAIDLTGLAAGLYLYRVVTPEGVFKTGTFIKL